MLKTISIESLFDIYSYTLDIKPDEVPLRFITGPNGYGKTTILNILNSLYTSKIRELAVIPFKHLQLTFDDGYEVTVAQLRDYTIDEDADESSLTNVHLDIEFRKSGNEQFVYSIKWNSQKEVDSEEDLGNSGLSLYFTSHPLYYIRDGRVQTPDGVPTVKKHVDILKALLRETENQSFRERLKVFSDIIKKSAFAHKTMQIDPRYGYRFIADNEERTILAVDKLSSGEQQMLIMAFELLFMAPDDSLVLIDEPEISFHQMWQVDYLANLQSIMALRNLQCIVSTHSPQIFNMNWDLSVDLYEQSQANL